MNMKIFIWILIALLATGCNTDNTITETPSDNPPVEIDPGDNPVDDNPGDIPGEENPDDTPPPVAEPTVKKVGWYLRTVAKAELADGEVVEHRTAGVFGELEDSSDGKDGHDIESYGQAVFQVRLLNEELGNDIQYFSDYRKYNGYDKKQVWTFQIKNEYEIDLSSASLRIDVEKMRNVLRKEDEKQFIETIATQDDKREQLILVDVDNQKTYTYAELKNLVLNMDGKHTRTFRWVLGSVDAADMEPLADSDAATTSAMRSLRTLSTQEKDNFVPRLITTVSKFGTPPE